MSDPEFSKHAAHGAKSSSAKSVAELLAEGDSEPFRLLVASVKDYAIFFLDPSGNICSWNAGAEQIKGYAPAEIVGRHFSVFYTPDALERSWPQEELRLASEGGRFEDEGWRVRKDGSRFWANVVITAVRNSTGVLIGFSKVTRDLTERKEHERRLEESERNLRLLVEGVQDYAIFQLSPEGVITSWNQGAERIKGYSAAEAIGQHFSMFYPESARMSHWPEEELRWASVRGRFEDEGWRLRKDGARIWANVVITAIRDGDGTLLGFSKVTRDLTERRKQETILKEREESLRQLVEGVQDQAMFLVDARGVIRTWNVGGEKLLGYTAPQMIGREVYSLYSGDGRSTTSGAMPDLAAGPDGRSSWEGWFRKENGERFWAHVATTATRRADGTLRGFVQVIRDVSDRRKVASLETEGRRLTEFIAMLSHELRNPLAPLSNALTILKRQPQTAQGEWCIDMAARQVSHVTRLIEDLLDVSRVTTGKIRLDVASIDLTALARDAVESLRPMVEEHGHELSIRLPLHAVSICGDATRLTQVLVNLVNNATKYTPRGGHIDVSLLTSNGLALLTVSDDGVGMSEELLGSAFEPFVQGVRELDRSEGGMGIGLTLVRHIAELHEGSVAATSPGPGQGTTVTVALPLCSESELQSAAPDSQPSALGQLDSLRVLVVDDNQDAAESLVMLLRIEGHDVKVAHSGAEALAIAAATKPQVVFLDVGLPGVSGLEVARQLRELPQLESVRLIAVTGYGQDSDRNATQLAGFDAHLVKPVDTAVLLQQLRW